MTNKYILVINPGSTSTKIAVFQEDQVLHEETLRHSSEELASFSTIFEQFDFRRKMIEAAIEKAGLKLQDLDAVVGRGGLLKPITSGTYRVNDAMLNDLKVGVLGQHASNLGGVLAYEIAEPMGKPSFIVDPVVVDEMEPLARYTGIPGVQRRSVFHALNQKAIARLAAKQLNQPYEAVNLIVVHLGGGITIGAHTEGRVVDVTNGLDGEGPMTPERSGALPAREVMNLTEVVGPKALQKQIAGKGGLVAHLGTNDVREVVEKIDKGDKRAEEVLKAMAYQVSKSVGAMATVLEGKVDGVVITGGIAYNDRFVSWIEKRTKFIAPIFVFPGEDELKALADGALRVLHHMEEAKTYE
ncbi:butyrate kinase [Gottschalkiaceae bacterium SANA]|nr:butyrate kinase [Gottschalkiaceae bacterium SANA]